jgi:hypothetical protein
VPEGLGTFSAVCVIDKISDLKMVATCLSFMDRLDDASNFVPWKARVTLFLMENGLWEFANYPIDRSEGPSGP